MRFALIGDGRMGRAIAAQASARGHERVAVHSGEAARRGVSLSREGLGSADVAFEFTAPQHAEQNVHDAIAAGVSVVCGTTGWTPGPALDAQARDAQVGVVVAPNFSLGMHLFYRLAQTAGELCIKSGLYDPYIVELHHRAKRDAPSGTARRLAEILQANAPDGAESIDDVSIASVRAGAEPGTHRLGFDAEADQILLEHRARSRVGFALGAVMAAEWMDRRGGLQRFEALLENWLERR